MATHMEVNHDSSTTIGDHYDSVEDTSGALSITAAAALNSTTYGIQNDVTLGTFWRTIKNTTGPASNELRFRFRLKNTDLANYPASSASGSEYIWRVQLGNNSTSDWLVIIELEWNNSSQLLWSVRERNTSDGDVTEKGVIGLTVIDDTEHCMEVRIVRESADGNADGEMEILLDGESKSNSTTKENYNSFGNLNAMRNIGNSGTAATSFTGDAYLDEFLIDDDASADLGCLGPFSGYDLVLGGGQP